MLRTFSCFGSRGKWLPRLIRASILFLVTLAASFALWDPLDIDERENVRRITLLSARSVEADLAADLRSRILAQVLLAGLWSGREELSAKELELSSHLFLNHHSGYLAVEWVTTTLDVKRIVARQANYQADLSKENDLLRPVLQATVKQNTDGAIISQSFTLPNGRQGNCVIVPNFDDKRLTGFLVTVLDTEAVLESVLSDHSHLGYSISISDSGSELYRSDKATSREFENAWAQNIELQIPGIRWRVRVWPTPEMLADMRSPLPELALVLGGLLGLLLMLTIHFARSAQEHSKQVLDAHSQLELRVVERTLELQRTNANLQDEIVERKKAEDSLQDLSSRLLRLQDEERRRIARDLHDSTVQLLGAGLISIDRVEMRAQKNGDPAATVLLREAREFLERATAELRTMSYLLHPPMLDELGMEYVLPWYAEGFSKRSGIKVELNIQNGIGRLPHEVELTLFRITQEALANIHRHSGSRTATIGLSNEHGVARLEIRDQGHGMPQNVLELAHGRSVLLGVGIAGMRERVRQLGGHLEMTSSPSGTTIRVELSLESATSGLDSGFQETTQIATVSGSNT